MKENYSPVPGELVLWDFKESEVPNGHERKIPEYLIGKAKMGIFVLHGVVAGRRFYDISCIEMLPYTKENDCKKWSEI